VLELFIILALYKRFGPFDLRTYAVMRFLSFVLLPVLIGIAVLIVYWNLE
jgi:hypothetical protein